MNERNKLLFKKEMDNMSVNLAIVYYSSTGTNYTMAKWAEEGAKAAGAEVRVVKAPELAPQGAIDSNPAGRLMPKQRRMFLTLL